MQIMQRQRLYYLMGQAFHPYLPESSRVHLSNDEGSLKFDVGGGCRTSRACWSRSGRQIWASFDRFGIAAQSEERTAENNRVATRSEGVQLRGQTPHARDNWTGKHTLLINEVAKKPTSPR
ncbi:hypothetical protein CFRS1_v009151 [Colletotrichum fructicola]|nr:hypothetical protein CFRS1_v009151 [Colletotrichum fructicola]